MKECFLFDTGINSVISLNTSYNFIFKYEIIQIIGSSKR